MDAIGIPATLQLSTAGGATARYSLTGVIIHKGSQPNRGHSYVVVNDGDAAMTLNDQNAYPIHPRGTGLRSRSRQAKAERHGICPAICAVQQPTEDDCRIGGAPRPETAAGTNNKGEPGQDILLDTTSTTTTTTTTTTNTYATTTSTTPTNTYTCDTYNSDYDRTVAHTDVTNATKVDFADTNVARTHIGSNPATDNTTSRSTTTAPLHACHTQTAEHAKKARRSTATNQHR